MRKVARVVVTCPVCGVSFGVLQSRLNDGRGKHCSKKCMAKAYTERTGPKSNGWRGGIAIHRGGRVRVKASIDHPYRGRDGYIHQARLVMEEHIGRYMTPSELIHHRDGNPANDDLSNLEIVTRGDHNKRHGFQGNMYIKLTKKERLCVLR